VIVGLLHPGAMGAALGDALATRGHEVLWASDGRSAATRARAARFRDVGTVAALAGESEVLLSVCPPHAALEVAGGAEGFDGLYVDANAISPATACEVAELHARFVDGGIVGSPPHRAGTTRLYLSGKEAASVAALFAGSVVRTRIVGDASALKMTYAAWSKGTAALLLAIRDVARANGVWDELQAEWRESAPELPARLEAAERSAAAKGWRWIAEMEEIADTFAAAGAPEGFHRAAAEVYRA
jgi:3-hydroxyisobutyrate dehydrogenase-like beta-hydroxyacid dehydrogenase